MKGMKKSETGRNNYLKDTTEFTERNIIFTRTEPHRLQLNVESNKAITLGLPVFALLRFGDVV